MKKKVGIFGGTFNPIHLAHLMLADAALEAKQLDEVLFIPTGALLSKTSFNEGQSVPGVAHAVILEKI